MLEKSAAGVREASEGRVCAVGERFNVGLVGLAVLQQRHRERRLVVNGDTVKGGGGCYHHGVSGSGSGTGGLVKEGLL